MVGLCGENPALTSFLSALVTALSLIHVNLSPDSIARCRPRWQSPTSLARIRFLQKHFADGGRVEGRR